MSAEWQVKVELKDAPVFQSMIAAGKVHSTGMVKLWSNVFCALLAFFAPLGILMTAVALGDFAGFDARDSLPLVLSWPLPILIIGLAVVCFWISWKPWKGIAAASVRSAFARTKHAQINPNGFTLTGGASHWQTGWSEVEAVVETKECFVVVVSAIALIVPRDAFASEEEADAALAAMQRWQKAARA